MTRSKSKSNRSSRSKAELIMFNQFEIVADKLHKIEKELDMRFINYTDYYNLGEVCIGGRRIPEIIEQELNANGFQIVYLYGTEFGKDNVSVTAQFKYKPKIMRFKLEVSCTQEQWNEVIRTLHKINLAATSTYQMEELN